MWIPLPQGNYGPEKNYNQMPKMLLDRRVGIHRAKLVISEVKSTEIPPLDENRENPWFGA